MIVLLWLFACVPEIKAHTIEAVQTECAAHGGLASIRLDLDMTAVCADGFVFRVATLPSEQVKP